MHDDGRVVAVFSGGGTGGHLYPALSIADALVALRPDVRPYFVGAERGLEARVLPRMGVDHVLLPVRGFDRSRPWRNLGVLVDLGRSVTRIARLFRQLRPGVVVVTGGYAGAPAGMVAHPMGIPLVLQEANSYPGVTNRRLATKARTIHLAFPEARDHLPSLARSRVVLSGNPIRPPRPIDRTEARRSYGLDPEGTVLLVVGGSQGSAAINDIVLGVVRDVEAGRLTRASDLHVLWAAGTSQYDAVSKGLDACGRPGWIHAVDYLDRMPDALAASDLAVGRGGAMSTSEFLAWGIPAIVIPLPSAAADHQSRNARALEAAGAAIHLPEAGLKPEGLWNAVMSLASDSKKREAMAAKARERGRPDSASDIARSIAEILFGQESEGDHE